MKVNEPGTNINTIPTMTRKLLLGQTLTFGPGADLRPDHLAAHHESDGAVLIDGGRIAAVGTADALRAAHPQVPVTDYGRGLISAGFVDTHMHYPQTAMIASWGKRLIDWLGTYTFPEEMRLADPAYADTIAARSLDLALAHGTTTVASYCTSHPHSVDAIFTAAAARDMRIVAGKTCMDRNAPAALLDTAQSAYDDSKMLLNRWHRKGRALYAITPRFTPTSTREQLHALGALWSEYPDCLMQTHLSEQVDECGWVGKLHPQARDYLDTYELADLLGERGLYGHAIHLTPRERARLREVGAALVHCPTSNTFIGSGIFDLAGLRAEGQRLAIATDVGGGSSFSMLRVMAATYEVSQLNGLALHPSELMWLATRGGAQALHLDGTIGTLAPGAEADLVILDLASTPAIAQRAAQADDFWQALFPTIMMGDDRAIAATWVAGRAISGSRT